MKTLTNVRMQTSLRMLSVKSTTMKKKWRSSLTVRTLTAISALFLVLSFGQEHLTAQSIAVEAGILHTGVSEPIENGVVLIEDGVITAVGSASDISIGDQFERLKAAVVTPGFIDAHSTVGLSGIYNVDADQDQLETSSAIQPELRAIDAYNAREELVGYLRDLGITTVHTGHGPGAVISGQTMIVKTGGGDTIQEVLMDSVTALAMTMGSAVRSNFDKPGTRSKAVAMLRQALIDAQDYASKEDKKRDLGKEALQALLEGEITALVTAHTVSDITTALRLQKEFGFPMMLDGASEAYLLIDEIREAGVPVIIHPSMIRTYGDAQSASFTTAGVLAEAGIPVVFQSGYEAYVPKTRVVHFEAAIAVANGLSHDQAIRSLTIDAAKLLGIDDKVGSVEIGKDADLALFDGDPFEYITNTTAVIINGEVVYRAE